MNTTAASHLTHDTASSDWYDDLGGNSPRLEPLRPMLQPLPSPPPPIASSKVSSPVNSGEKRTKSRTKVKPSRGDAILLGYLGGHRSNDVADLASMQGLASEAESQEDTDLIDDSDSVYSSNLSQGGDKDRDGERRASGAKRMSIDQPDQDDMGSLSLDAVASGGAFDLKSLAASALATVTDVKQEPVAAGPTPPRTDSDIAGARAPPQPPAAAVPFPNPVRQPESFRDERTVPVPVQLPVTTVPPSHFSPPALVSPHLQHASPVPLGPRSPTNSITSSTLSENLAPLNLGSPRYDTNGNGHTLPSIRSQLGDFKQLANNHAAETERLRASHHMFPRSPTTNVPRFIHGPGSPPTSPVEVYRRDASTAWPIPPGHPVPNAFAYTSPNYSGSSTATPGSDQSGSTPGAMPDRDRMNIENLTNHVVGTYICPHSGCNAAPFTTQYLLNSHMNVHSSSRPHYCPVPGCPRGEGGKGFKRKNEMIRHGLVHDSPGYVCPFCPDREHKYPRPDNLQRHVRVHHVDKDKDDPALRDVLAQRPDGPSRGRRRRGAAT
ncbi:metallothionein expression activator [Cladorrhinum sp. PSN259]|nr:metallothionein expression activator [Cladorrhinum sp. PSN259]